MTRRTAILALILALTFIGIADSWYLAESAYTNTALTCNVGGALSGCNIVEQSPYARLFGIPLGAYGLAFYCLAFALTAAAFFESGPHAKRTLHWVSIIGAIASLIFIGIQVFVIRALCIYCLASAVDSFLVCYLAYLCYRKLTVSVPKLPVVEPWS